MEDIRIRFEEERKRYLELTGKKQAEAAVAAPTAAPAPAAPAPAEAAPKPVDKK